MAEQKEFESLDELFRKTFDNLPETPAKSGWDTPSEQVWKHVQKQIKPPQSGWSTQTLSLIAAFAVIITVGLYLLFNRPAQPEQSNGTTPSAATIESAEQPVTSALEETSPAQPAAPETTTLPAKSGKKKTTGASKPKSQSLAEPSTTEQIESDPSFEKPAAQTRKVPNTTLRLKAELAKHAEEAWKTPLDPLPQRWPNGSEN